MVFGPHHRANYTTNNAEIITIEQTDWQYRRGESFNIANLIRTFNEVNISQFQ
jgi:hypothetical protein